MTMIHDGKLQLDINGKSHGFTACIFDFDGVVVDTEKYHLLSWNSAFDKHGAIISDSEYPPLKSTGKSNIIGFVEKKYGLEFTDAQKAEIYAAKIDAFNRYQTEITENDIINGVTEFLTALKTAHIKTAVASSASSTSALIKKFGLDPLFDAVIDGNANYKKKPAPDIFLAAAKLINANPSDCLVFEDSTAGIEAAVAAGMSVVSVGITHEKALMRINDFTERKKSVN